MSIRDKIINGILDREGEAYTNNPADSGGPTKWGITEAVARERNYRGDMRDLTRTQAFFILVAVYWNPICGNQLEKLSPVIAEEVADTAVNCGPARAGVFLQRCLNVLNRRGKLYEDLVLDGQIGPRTLKALAAYLDQRQERVLHTALNCLQGAFYIDLADDREKDEEFVYGWLSHRIVL